MFKRLLVPVTKEGLPEMALKRSAELSASVGSKVIISYFIDDTLYEGVGDQVMHVLTEHDKEMFQRNMVRTQEQVAKRIIKNNVITILGSRPEEFVIRKGPIPETILGAVDEFGADALMIEYGSYDLLKYRVMDRSTVPVWIERHDRPIKRIGLFLADPRQSDRLIDAAKALRSATNASLRSYFIADPKAENTEEALEGVVSSRRIRFEQVIKERPESSIREIVHEKKLDLIVIGHMGKKGYFHLRSGFARKRPCSVLLIN